MNILKERCFDLKHLGNFPYFYKIEFLGCYIRLAYRFKFEKQFKKPCKEWLDMIETMCNEILGNYTKKED
jgi:hypothetical protein